MEKILDEFEKDADRYSSRGILLEKEKKKERKRDRSVTKKEGSGGEEVKSTPHLLPESSWRAEPEWSPLLSVAQTPALDRSDNTHTQEVHPTKDREQTNKTKMGMKNKTTTQKIIRVIK